ncbi:MAG: MBL fold metallo-hydrolase, partial [Candidatus Omnitrophota bacterium]
MIIEWLGHSAFLITSKKDIKIITDPYQSGSYGGAVSYDPIKLSPDIVTISHSHPDHSYIDSLGGKPEVINKEGKFNIKGVSIKGITAYHDEQKGNARGNNIIFSFNIDDISVVHLGDLGHQIDEELTKNIYGTDVLLVPVGGVFTINAKQAQALINRVNPKITIPMHFKTEKLGFGIDSVGSFLRNTNFAIERIDACSVSIDKNTLGQDNKMIVL